jgi:uncharacterized oxidoreductase
VQTELTGPGQATDPNAVPLADYIAEVTQVLSGQRSLPDEILVPRVEALRWAEKKGEYARIFESLNG